MEARRLLLELYRAALERVDGRRCVAEFLRSHPLDTPPRILALGKAAPAMMHGALDVLDEGFESALLVTRHGYLQGRFPGRVHCIESGHPLPDADSLRAGEAIWSFVAEGEGPLLMLLSGGASALAERPIEGVGLDDLLRLNERLLASGEDIAEMNLQRRRLSTLKGGGLARRLKGAALNLMISDVPGDAPAVIGSGPLVADGAPIEHHIIARNADARAAVSAMAREMGLAVHEHDGVFQGEARLLGERFARELIDGPPGLYIWGGESTVTLPDAPGRGGRSQQLALAAATVIAGRDDCLLLAAGTDGSDGPGDDAGALVDGGTIGRGAEEGMDALDCLRRADSGAFLAESSDLIQTGPTGTNVMDLVLALKTV